jgi:hypothetical protein
MKTIFRFLSLAAVVAAFSVAGATVGFAQDPCTDTAGQDALSNKVRELFPKTDPASQAAKIEAGKQFLEKYGACDAVSVKEFADYLKPNIPKWEANYKKVTDKQELDGLVAKFNTGLNSKNWDDVYAAGKQLLEKAPEDFRAAELVLGSIGLDETSKTPRVTKWNDDTLKYAKMSVADLESGKTFKTFGVNPFTYKNKEDALGWMNYTIGYITFFDKNNKKEGVSYLYKATQAASDTKQNPVVYASIGGYYFDDVKVLAKEVQEMIAGQSKDDTPEIAKQKVDAIKAKVALLNGTSEAAIDAYARAYNLAKADVKKYPKTYTDGLYKTLGDLYNVRFGKMDGFEAWIAKVDTKPMPNPTVPVTPISDPEPATPPTTTTTSGSTVKPGTATAPAPATTKPADAATAPKPAAKPAGSVKGQASLKKSVVKKRS